MLGCTGVGFQERVIGAIPLDFFGPFRLLLHVDVFGMKQSVKIFLLYFFEFRVGIFVAIFDPFEPFLSFFFGDFDVVDFAVVVAVNFVFEVIGEAAFGVLVIPKVTQSRQIHNNNIEV